MNKILHLIQIKEEIRQAIMSHGVDVPKNTPLSDFSKKILSINAQTLNIEPKRKKSKVKEV